MAKMLLQEDEVYDRQEMNDFPRKKSSNHRSRKYGGIYECKEDVLIDVGLRESSDHLIKPARQDEMPAHG